jgi:hypothetical protein
MYYITETGHGTYMASYSRDVVRHALDFAREHGPYSGMEDLDEANMEECISWELDQTGKLDLYIGGPKDHYFTVVASGG